MNTQKFKRNNREHKKLKFSSLFPAIFGREVIVNQSDNHGEESYFYIYQNSIYVYRFVFSLNTVILEKDDQRVDIAYYDPDGLEFYKKYVMLHVTTKALVDRSPTLAKIFEPEGRLVREEDIVGLMLMCDVMEITSRRIRLNLYALKRTDFFDIHINPETNTYDIIKNGKVTIWENQTITDDKNIFTLAKRLSVERAKAMADAVEAWQWAWYWRASEGNSSELFLGRNDDENIRIECLDTDKKNLKVIFENHPTFFLDDEQSFGKIVGQLEECTTNPEDLTE